MPKPLVIGSVLCLIIIFIILFVRLIIEISKPTPVVIAAAQTGTPTPQTTAPQTAAPSVTTLPPTTTPPATTPPATTMPVATAAVVTVPVIKPRQNVVDTGYSYADRPLFAHKPGWYDVQNQGVPNDYCRYVGDYNAATGQWWSCALAGRTNEHDPTFDYRGGPNASGNASLIADQGYSDGQLAGYGMKLKRGFYNLDGTTKYCRYVGNASNHGLLWTCTDPSKPTEMYPNASTFQSPAA